MIKIDKNIPIPEIMRGGKGGRKSKYPWNLMDVGDSFFVENPPRQKNGQPVPLGSAANKRYAPKKFTYRKENDGIRVWRIA